MTDPRLLRHFADFVQTCRPASVPILAYYLDAVKALKAIRYSHDVAETLRIWEGHEFTRSTVTSVINDELQEKADLAFASLVREELPAYITHTWVQGTSASIRKRVTGITPAPLRQMSEGLAEVFCLTDPSREDNPIVFASEEFYRTTQYGVGYAIGRNCRFL